MSTVTNLRLDLQPSLIKLGCLFLAVVIIAVILYVSLKLMTWLFIMITWAIVEYLHLKYFKNNNAQFLKLHHLDNHEWSMLIPESRSNHVAQQQNSQIQRLIFKKLVDYGFCMVISTSNTQSKTIIIWRDQLKPAMWKALKRYQKLM